MAESRHPLLEAVWSRNSRLVLTFLVLAALLTWIGGIWDVSRLESAHSDLSAEKRVEAVTLIQAELDHLYVDLRNRASEIARRESVIDGFRQLGENQSGREELVQEAASLRLEARQFVEFYDPTPTLTAWKGAVFPMDSAVQDERFLAQVQESLVLDGQSRTAVIVWVPVRDGTSVLGVIRLGQIVESRMPLKNDYLRDYTWDEEWSRQLERTVTFTFGLAVRPSVEGDYFLRSPLDFPVGSVSITDANLAAWRTIKKAQYVDVLAFWLFMLIFYVIVRMTSILWRYVPGEGSSRVARGPIFGYLGILLISRWILLFAHIPSRWQTGKAPLAPLFDAQHLASVFGFGSLRTIGDLFITALAISLGALMILRLSAPLRERIQSILGYTSSKISLRVVTSIVLHQIVVLFLAAILFQIAQHAVLDSTLDLFARSGLLPEQLVLVVFGALLLLVFSVILLGGRSLWLVTEALHVPFDVLPSKNSLLLIVGVTAAVISALISFVGPVGNLLPVEIFIIVVSVTYVTAFIGPIQPTRRSPIVVLRRIVPMIIVTSMVLFPMLEMSSNRKVELRMQDAAESFLEDRDSRVMFAISQVLGDAHSDEFGDNLDLVPGAEGFDRRSRMDSLVGSVTKGTFLTALASYDVTITLFDDDGSVQGRYSNLNRRLPRAMQDAADESEFDLFTAMYDDFGNSGSMIEKLTGSKDQNRFRYAGFRLLRGDGFILVLAEQRALAGSAASPFPKVLAPGGYYGDRYSDLSVAEFRDGVLVRTEGKNFGRTILDRNVTASLQGETDLWTLESVRDREYQTFYRVEESLEQNAGIGVTAVRRRTTNVFDQLYHLLRIVVAGLFLAMPFYFGGLFFRLRNPSLQPDVRQFRDKVLNAFFSVGIITVVAMGVVGLGVVTEENEQAIESWLRQHLERVEQTLDLETRGEELPYRVLDRISVDSLAARVGLDLNVYHNLEVEQASRPELIRDRLIERRLPIEAYEALYFKGFRFITVEEKLGTFAYKAGYIALTDERGIPHYVVSIPTLPEQERIEEERARTVAYLFGALLLLVLVVMVTASLLANALTRPIAQLRAGLKAVAAGHFERISKVDTGDEIADLVDSFNTMQDQIEESRHLLGQQERQLAWREMARQVAHEIKNPLTPMKLSIQHLRTAFNRRSEDGSDDDKFSRKFSQTTSTLIEQIDTLARIANEFSSFGRMPKHIREEVNLNDVIAEAVELMQAEDNVNIEMELHPTALIVSGDREAVRRVYVNFLKNAIQAVPEDRMAEISVSTNLQTDVRGVLWVLGRVSDNGSGISRNLWEKIFVPSFSTKTSGTGLGLAIARRTIESMDGEIGFDTELNSGTTFWIKVPLSVSETRSEERSDPETDSKASQEPESAADSPDGSHPD